MHVPCVSFDVKIGPSEIISNGENGILIAPFDCASMAEKIDALLKNRELLQKMAENTLMDFERFKYIMTVIQDFDRKREKVSDFFEENLCTSSFCYVDYGCELQNTLINMLADEFDCWYDTGAPFLGHENDKSKEWWEARFNGWSNDIEYWLYDAKPDNKSITINNNEVSINTLEEFYEYLIKNYEERNQVTP